MGDMVTYKLTNDIGSDKFDSTVLSLYSNGFGDDADAPEIDQVMWFVRKLYILFVWLSIFDRMNVWMTRRCLLTKFVVKLFSNMVRKRRPSWLIVCVR
jgi:hypothetical protein